MTLDGLLDLEIPSPIGLKPSRRRPSGVKGESFVAGVPWYESISTEEIGLTEVTSRS